MSLKTKAVEKNLSGTVRLNRPHIGRGFKRIRIEAIYKKSRPFGRLLKNCF
jgi:hypothetical protein